MKKILVYLMLVCIALLPAAAMAEAEPAVITWEEVGAPAVEAMELEGDFVALEDMGLTIWIPASLVYTEPSEEDAAAGRYAIFMDEDGECALIIDAVNVEGMTLDQAYQNAVDSGMEEPELVTVNGLDTLSYKNAELNTGCIVLVDTNSNMIVFSFTPMEGEEAEMAFGIIGSSLMPLE